MNLLSANFLATSFIHFGVASAVVIASNFLFRALLEARGERTMVLRAGLEGVCVGLRLRGRHPGKLPAHVKRLFYANFLFGVRLATQRLPRLRDRQ